MLQRTAEIVFRSKLLILIPLLILVPATTALALRPRPPVWLVSTTVWVDPYKLLFQDDRLGYTPAANQSELLRDFIFTRSFSQSVLEQTRLKPDVQNPDALERDRKLLWDSIQVQPTSNSFLVILVAMKDPALAYSVARAINSTYQDILQKQMDSQTSVAASLYHDELTQAADRLSKSQGELSQYLAQHPGLSSSSLSGASDGNLSLLLEQLGVDQSAFRSAEQRYEDFERIAAAGKDAQPFTFTVVDPPQMPHRPVPVRLLARLELPALGLVVGLILSGGVAALLVLTSHAIVDPGDVERFLGVPLLGIVPQFSGGGALPRRRRTDEVRTLVAAPARPVAASGFSGNGHVFTRRG